MIQNLMSRHKGQKVMEKTMVVMVFLLVLGMSQAASLKCSTDSECRRNVCINLSCAPRSLAGGACSTNSHCFSSTNGCISQTCSLLSPAGGACDANDNADCAVASSTCSNKVCLSPTGGSCSQNDQCVSVTDTCIGGTCKTPASAGETCDLNDDADCGTPDYICDGTACSLDLSPLDWEGNKAMATRRNLAASVAVGDFLLVFGGRLPSGDLSKSVEMYDPATNSWVFKADMPVASWKHSVVAVGKYVYLLGIADESSNAQTKFFRYDTELNVWSLDGDLPQLPSGIHSTAAAVAGTTIYAFGGQTGLSFSTAKDTIYAFDTTLPENGWSLPTTLSQKLTQASAVAVNDQIYISGGLGDEGNIQSRTSQYDTNNPSNTPGDTRLDLAKPRFLHVTFYNAENNKLHVVGGLSNFQDGARTVETLDLNNPTMWFVSRSSPLYLFYTANSGGLIGSRFYLPGAASTEDDTEPSSLLFVVDSKSNLKWVPFAPSSTPSLRMALGKIGSTIITAAGPGQFASSSQTSKYDITSDSWSDVGDTLFTSVPASAVVGDQLFSMGGLNGGASKQTIVFDNVQSTWNPRANLNVARYGLCAASQGTKIFAFGGISSENPFTVLDTMEIYETDNTKANYDSWRDVTTSSKSPGKTPTPVIYCAAVSTGTKILIFGGLTSSDPTSVTGLIQSFDIATEKWDAPISKTITPRHLLSAIVLREYVIIIGGADSNSYPLATVESYNIYSGKISALTDIPSPRFGHGSVIDGDSVIVVGGQNGALFASLEKFSFPVA